jgi:hypothetical protein
MSAGAEAAHSIAVSLPAMVTCRGPRKKRPGSKSGRKFEMDLCVVIVYPTGGFVKCCGAQQSFPARPRLA